jgi:hypothetical protein
MADALLCICGRPDGLVIRWAERPGSKGRGPLTPEREASLRAYLRALNPELDPAELDSIDLAIFDCGGCG